MFLSFTQIIKFNVSRLCKLCLIFFLAGSCTGCVSHYRAQEIETRLLVLEDQIKQMRKDTKSKSKQQNATLEHISSEFKVFKGEVTQSIDRIRKGSASESIQIDGMEGLIEKLKGDISELRFKLSKLESQGVTNTEIPTDKNALYNLGLEHLRSQKYKEATLVFTEFVKRYPDEIRVDDSLFHIAEAYYHQSKYMDSVEVIKQIITTYAQENQADQALILLFDNYIALDQCNKALDALTFLEKTYPRSNQLRIAKHKRRKVGKCK